MGALKTFPVSVVVAGRRVAVIGGGEPAAGKLRLLAKTQAQVHVFGCAAEGHAAQEAGRHGYAVHQRLPDIDDLKGAALAFIATEDAAQDRTLSEQARAVGVPVNVVDRPELCDVLTPAFVDRAPLTVAISTEGAAPVLAGLLRSRIERLLAPGLGPLAALAGSLRERVAELLPSGPRRLAFWRDYFAHEDLAETARNSPVAARRRAMRLLEAARCASRQPGMVWIVGIGPGAADLLTVRAQRTMAEADVVIHDTEIEAGLLDHIRRDARRVEVAVGGEEVSLLAAEARRGRRVVRLWPGDPGRDAAARELLAGLERNAIASAVVPGIAGVAVGRPAGAPGVVDEVAA